MKSGNACSSTLAGSSFAIASMNVSLVFRTISRKLVQSAISVRNGTTLSNIPMVLWNSSSVRPAVTAFTVRSVAPVIWCAST